MGMDEQAAMRKLLQSPETLGTVVHAILRRLYGAPVYDWDLTTVMMEVRDDLGVYMSDGAINRWGAIQVLLANNAFFTRLDGFLAIANALNEGQPFFEVFDPVTTEEAAWAIAEASLNRELLPFGPAIRGYLRTVLRNDGLSADSPEIFDAVFEGDAAHQRVRQLVRQIHRSPNADTTEAYVEDQLRDLASQFAQVPSLSDVGDLMLQPAKTEEGDE